MSVRSDGAGAALGMTTAGPARAPVEAERTFSGRATTTGPGRPVRAVAKARATSSGMRSAASISTVHLARVPKTAR